MPGSATFHKVFFAAYGFGPYECFFCRRSMSFEEMNRVGTDLAQGCVHHIDENRDNNHPFNLVATHRKCHNRWHNHRRRGVPRPPEIQENLRKVNIGRKLSEEHKAAISPRGRKHSAATRAKMRVPKSREHRAKISAALKRAWAEGRH